MSYWDKEDYIFFGLMGALLAILFFVTGMVVYSGMQRQKELQQELEADACEQTSSVPTGKRVYCGKACWRDEMKIEYSCKSGVKIVYK